MLNGDAAEQYYITGGSAGYYEAPEIGAVSVETAFRKVGDEGDQLPATLSFAEVE